MKKIVLSFALLMVAIAAQAQDNDVAEGELNYIFDHETMTATVTQNRWWQDYEGGMGGQWHNTYEGDIVIPETVAGYTVVAIGQEAFANLANDSRSISSISIPKTVKTIGDRAFNGCYNQSAFSGCKAIKEITIPATATSIGERAFQNSSLEKCIISDSEQSLTINRNIFDGMDEGQLQLYIGRPLTMDAQSKPNWDGARALREITYGGSYSGMAVEEAYNCKGLQKLVISSPLVTEIPEQAFMYCENLTSVTLHDGIKAIGKEAFRNDKQITAIVLPQQLTTIGESAFYGCKFSSVALPDQLTTIHENAFYNCPLKNIKLPASVTLLGRNSFGTDGPLKNIICKGSTPPVCEGFPFYYTNKARNGEMKLYVPEGAVSAYQNAEHWKEFFSIGTEVPTGIALPAPSSTLPEAWYTLDGRRLAEAPTRPGCYICNGKKTVVR